MKKPLDATAQRTLEDMIDTYGLAELIDALGDICSAKAAHIHENWQDDALARQWDGAARAMIRANSDARVQRVGR